jgi:glycosyltransferase involved in cell wall biosynthesis
VPHVTAAITTYDRAELVVEAVESALAQSYGDVEVLVVDNGSKDGTANALAPYRERIRYVYQENAGRAGARNRAIQEAHGDYVAFLDADDVWLPDKLERQVPVLDARSGVALVHGHVEAIDAFGRPLPRSTARHRRLFARAHRHGASYAAYALDCRCLTSTVLARRDVLERIGGYDPSVALEDVDLYLRVALEGEIVFLEGAPLARYRLHGGQTARDEHVRGQLEVCLKHLRLLDERPDAPGVRAAQRNFLLSLAYCHYMLGNRGRTRRTIAQAVAVDPRALLVGRASKWLVLSLLPVAVRRGGARVRDRIAPAR